MLSNNFDLQRCDVHLEIIKLHRELAILRQEVTDLTLQLGISNVTHVTEANCLYEEIGELCRHLEEARASGSIEEPSAY